MAQSGHGFMTVFVSDTSVLIDLERGALLETAFALPFEFAVPDLLYAQELRPHHGDRLLEWGLRIETLSPDDVARAVDDRRSNPSLSLPDAFALALARSQHWTLLTGDRALRELAESEGVECHGVLWVLDRIYEARIISAQHLREALQAIADHPRCRLPRREIRLRLAQYTPRID